MSFNDKDFLSNETNEEHNILDFLRYELRLLNANRNNTKKFIHHLVVSAFEHFNLQQNTEEIEKITAQLIQEQKHSSAHITSDHSVYYPPFILQSNPELKVDQQHVTKATKIFAQIQSTLMELIDVNLTTKMNRKQFSAYIKPLIEHSLRKMELHINAIEQAVLENIFLDEVLAFGPLEPLLADPTINDILVNSPDKIYVERFGTLIRAGVSFRNKEHLLHTIHQMVSRAGRRIDGSRPYVNVKLMDGTRINAIIPPIVLESPTLSIRKFSKNPIYLENMVMSQNMSPEMAMLLYIAVRSRLNILISGGTGSGKTTLLNAISDAIDESERIITIEDIAELRLNKEHVVRLETRNASIEGGGSITERELLINALRMRPDRIILGEVRGSEAFDMLQAMNTGHEGSMSTIHANRVEDVPFRFVDMLAMANVGLTVQSSLQQINSAIDLIVHTNRLLDGVRRVTHISELVEVNEGTIKLQDLFEFKYQVNAQTGAVEGEFVQHQTIPLFVSKAAHFGLDKHLMALFRL